MNSQQLPRIGVSALVEHEGKILIIQRGQSPNKGQLAFPGGKLQWGETLTQAVERELYEETAVTGRATHLLHAVNIIAPDDHEKIIRHYVVLCYRCQWLNGTAQARDDASQVYWLSAKELLSRTDVVEGVKEVLRKIRPI